MDRLFPPCFHQIKPESITQTCSLSKLTTAPEVTARGGHGLLATLVPIRAGSFQVSMSMTLHTNAPLPVTLGAGYLKHVPLPAFRQIEPAPLCVRCVHVIHITVCLLGKEFLCLMKHLLESLWKVEKKIPINDQCSHYGTFDFIYQEPDPNVFPHVT